MDYLSELLRLAAENKIRVTSSTGGRHNPGSLHGKRRAIDVDHRGMTQDIIRKFEKAGYRVIDERVRPKGQKVWGGPHYHIERPFGGSPLQMLAGGSGQTTMTGGTQGMLGQMMPMDQGVDMTPQYEPSFGQIQGQDVNIPILTLPGQREQTLADLGETLNLPNLTASYQPPTAKTSIQDTGAKPQMSLLQSLNQNLGVGVDPKVPQGAIPTYEGITDYYTPRKSGGMYNSHPGMASMLGALVGLMLARQTGGAGGAILPMLGAMVPMMRAGSRRAYYDKLQREEMNQLPERLKTIQDIQGNAAATDEGNRIYGTQFGAAVPAATAGQMGGDLSTGTVMRQAPQMLQKIRNQNFGIGQNGVPSGGQGNLQAGITQDNFDGMPLAMPASLGSTMMTQMGQAGDTGLTQGVEFEKFDFMKEVEKQLKQSQIGSNQAEANYKNVRSTPEFLNAYMKYLERGGPDALSGGDAEKIYGLYSMYQQALNGTPGGFLGMGGTKPNPAQAQAIRQMIESVAPGFFSQIEGQQAAPAGGAGNPEAEADAFLNRKR